MARNWNTTHRWLSTRCGYRYLPTPSKKCKHCTIWDLWILLQSLELDAIEKITGYRIHRHLVIMMRTALGGNCGKLLQLCVLATRVRKSYEPAFGPTKTRQNSSTHRLLFEGIRSVMLCPY